MYKLVFAVKDCLTGFLDPFCMSCERDAILAFEAALRDPRCAISKSPNDYDLYRIGTFYQMTGVIETWDAGIYIVARGAALSKQHDSVSESEVDDDAAV